MKTKLKPEFDRHGYEINLVYLEKDYSDTYQNHDPCDPYSIEEFAEILLRIKHRKAYLEEKSLKLLTKRNKVEHELSSLEMLEYEIKDLIKKEDK